MAGDSVMYSGSSATQGYGSRGGGSEPANLADILERVLDKGLVIAGDIRVNLLDIELLTIKLRLVIASVDTARQIGINWWETDPWLHSGGDSGRRALPAREDLAAENRELRERIEALESGQPADRSGGRAQEGDHD